MHYYCTLFDRNYLPSGLALFDSLARHCAEFNLAVLCLDETTEQILRILDLPGLEPVSLSTLEQWDPELERVRLQRSIVEYYFTCKPVLMKFLAEKYRNAARITYLDSDLFYFSDPRKLEQDYAGSSAALTPHRFPSRLSERKRFGRFNAGWVSASCAGEGRRFIDWWRARCIEWCRMEVQADRFADQKYLDMVPDLFSDVTILEHPGANLAPWNLEGITVNRSAEGILAEGSPVYFFHFHGMRKVIGRLYDSGLRGYGVPLSPQLRANLYFPYLASLADAEARVRQSVDRLGMKIPHGPFSLTGALRKYKRAVQLVANGTSVIGP